MINPTEMMKKFEAQDDIIRTLRTEGERDKAQLRTIRKLAGDWLQGAGEGKTGIVLNAIWQHADGKAEPVSGRREVDPG